MASAIAAADWDDAIANAKTISASAINSSTTISLFFPTPATMRISNERKGDMQLCWYDFTTNSNPSISSLLVNGEPGSVRNFDAAMPEVPPERQTQMRRNDEHRMCVLFRFYCTGN
jgi:hypothetical protein